MSSHLPQEILIEILLWLPVKFILRFRLVSRSWNSLITSRSFIDLQLRRSTEAHDPLIIQNHYDRQWGHYTVYRDNGGSLTEEQELMFPLNTDTKYYHICACNGLLCLSDYSEDKASIVLWNPSIRTYFQLPLSSYVDKADYFVIGLGFDCWTNQYKVLRINLMDNLSPVPPKAEIFVLGTEKWRGVNTHFSFILHPHQTICVQSAIHWIGDRSGESKVIMAFDVHDEVFRDFEFPSNLAVPHSAQIMVAAYRESLGLVEFSDHAGPSMLFIWVMKQYGVNESWTKLFGIDMGVHRGLRTVLWFRKHGKILGENVRKELVSYDPKSEMVEELVVHRKHENSLVPSSNDEVDSNVRDHFCLLQLYGFDDAVSLIECLVLLEGTNELQGSAVSCSLTAS